MEYFYKPKYQRIPCEQKNKTSSHTSYSESISGAELPYPSNWNSREQTVLARVLFRIFPSILQLLWLLLIISNYVVHISFIWCQEKKPFYSINVIIIPNFQANNWFWEVDALPKPAMSNSQLGLLISTPKVFLPHVKHEEWLSMWSLWSDWVQTLTQITYHLHILVCSS